MIESGGNLTYRAFSAIPFDILLYGLGFETRSTNLAARADAHTEIYAIQMPEILVHRYEDNLRFAQTRKHRIISDLDDFLTVGLGRILKRFRSRDKIRIGFDISSLNRIMIYKVIDALACLLESQDRVEVFYCPARFSEPDWRFPQIERLGPIDSLFSSFDSEPTKPLCVVLGVGFEPGISMGIISHLEPQISYCVWGSGVDSRFDEAVRRANFGFEFPGFATRAARYPIRQPLGSFSFLESITYGLLQKHRVIIIPMGPKIFALYAILLGMMYVGDLAVWRVQHSRQVPVDVRPSRGCVQAVLNTSQLKQFAQKRAAILSSDSRRGEAPARA